jgi:hypothetical protein
MTAAPHVAVGRVVVVNEIENGRWIMARAHPPQGFWQVSCLYIKVS